MKLLYCTTCHDVVLLTTYQRTCECGATGGQYIDQSRAKVFGDGIPFAYLTEHFQAAVESRPDDWPGPWFMGFVLPKAAENILHIEDNGPGT